MAISSLASLHYNQAQGNQPLEKKTEQLDEAKKWYHRLAEVEPNNKEAYYSLGVITWAKWYPELMAARAKLGMKPEDPGPIKDKKVREELKAKWGPTVEEGINNLKHALEIDPEYDDAMAYINLLTRERADLSDTPEGIRRTYRKRTIGSRRLWKPRRSRRNASPKKARTKPSSSEQNSASIEAAGFAPGGFRIFRFAMMALTQGAMDQIGRYKILGEVGHGAMGVVYRAQDPAIGRIVAIKMIRLGDLADPV